MKNILLLFVLFAINICIYSQKSINNLKNIHLRNLDQLMNFGKVEKVELTDSTTILYINKIGFEEKNIFKLPENLFIYTESDSTQYKLQKVEGITYNKNSINIGEEISINKGKEIAYKLFFEGIPKASKFIEVAYYEDKNSIKGFKREITKISRLISLQESNNKKLSDSIFSNISFKKALKKAKEENKKILLFFYDISYNTSINIKDYIFTNKDIKEKLQEEYIVLRMNLNKKEAHYLYKTYIQGKLLPQFTILSPDGNLINNYSGEIKVKDFLRFIELEKLQEEKKEIFKFSNNRKKIIFKLGTRVMLMNSSISNQESDTRTSVSSDIYLATTFNGWYFFRTGIGFSSKGSCETPINYLKMPFEFGIALHKGYFYDVPLTIRVIGGPYYAFRVNKSNLDIAKNDYGFRIALAPNIGETNSELSLSLYYDYGMKDIFRNIGGFQRNHSFGIGINLTL